MQFQGKITTMILHQNLKENNPFTVQEILAERITHWPRDPKISSSCPTATVFWGVGGGVGSYFSLYMFIIFFVNLFVLFFLNN